MTQAHCVSLDCGYWYFNTLEQDCAYSDLEAWKCEDKHVFITLIADTNYYDICILVLALKFAAKFVTEAVCWKIKFAFSCDPCDSGTYG